jgi:hypothetical protein
MSAINKCGYCDKEVVFAKTKSGHKKALNPEPISSRIIAEFEGRAIGWALQAKSKELVLLSDLAEVPFWAYVEHKCAEYLLAQPIEPIPHKAEAGLVKVGDCGELQDWRAKVEALIEINKVKEARKVRQLLTESEPTNYEVKNVE